MFFLCLIELIAVSSAAIAQEDQTSGQNQQSAIATPTDPRELMLLAARMNGLTGDGVKPWHLKVTYTLLGEDGKTTDQGTYEEFWVSQTKFKRVFTGNNSTQADYGTEKGVMRSGARQDFHTLLLDARRDLVDPLPSEKAIEHEEFSLKQVDSNGVKLSCLSITGQPALGLTYCLNPGQPILRISGHASEAIQVLHNRILHFQDRTIAGDLKIVRFGKTELTAHVESIEPLEPVNEADFTPPADAQLVPKMINISGGLAAAMLTYAPVPTYPPTARANHISGTVVLKGTIGKDGHVKNLEVVSGPGDLRMAAVDAVRFWRYKPYLLNGEPVEVMTTINAVFTLDR